MGYPNWYVELLKNKKDKISMKQVNMVDTTIEIGKQVEGKQQEWMVELIKQDMAKYFKAKQSENDSAVNYIHIGDFACMQ